MISFIRYIAGFFLLSILFSCSPQKHLNNLLRRHPELVKTHDTIIWKDSTIIVHDSVMVPGADLWFDTLGFLPPLLKYHHTEKKGALTSTVDISGGHLTTECKEDSIQRAFDSEHKIRLRLEVEKSTAKGVVEVWPWWCKITLVISILFLIENGIIGWWKYLKK